MGFSESFIQQLKGQVDIIQLTSDYIRLEQSGNRYKALCPFHQEKTPSFHVDPLTGLYHCFGCHASGDVISFIEQIENLNFLDSVKFLAEKYNIELEYEEGYNAQDKSERESLLEILQLACDHYRQEFEKHPDIKGYAASRNLYPETQVDLKVGYATGTGLLEKLRQKGYSNTLIEQAGLLNQKGYEKFRNRLMFPIENLYDKVVGFGGRLTEDNTQAPKYLNSPATPVFEKRKMLYGLNKTREFIRKTGYVIVVEGYMDFAALYQEGIVNVAASLGTAFTEDHASLIKRFAKNVYLSFDSDRAGLNAALKSYEVLAAGGLYVYGIELPEGDDPDDFVRKNGKESFMMLVDSAEEIPIFLSRKIAGASDFKELPLNEKMERLEMILNTLTHVPDKIRQSYYVKEIAEMFQISESDVASQLKAVSRGIKKTFEKKKVNQSPLETLHSSEKTLLLYLKNNPSKKEEVRDLEKFLTGLPVYPFYQELMAIDYVKIGDVIRSLSSELQGFINAHFDEVTLELPVLEKALHRHSVLYQIAGINEKLNLYKDSLTDDEAGELMMQKMTLQKEFHKIK